MDKLFYPWLPCDYYIAKLKKNLPKKYEFFFEFATFKFCNHTSSSKVAGFKKKNSFLLILSPNLIKQIDKQILKKHPKREQEKKKKRKD
jgi:hypothetical protein